MSLTYKVKYVMIIIPDSYQQFQEEKRIRLQ